MDDNDRIRWDLGAELFKAIGHPMRLAMLEKLRDQSWCVCDIAASLDLNKSVASKHLSLLYDVGLLEVEKRGTQVIYTLAAPCLVDMARCGHQAVVEQKRKRLGEVRA